MGGHQAISKTSAIWPDDKLERRRHVSGKSPNDDDDWTDSMKYLNR